MWLKDMRLNQVKQGYGQRLVNGRDVIDGKDGVDGKDVVNCKDVVNGIDGWW